jgi:hypothetical protein
MLKDLKTFGISENYFDIKRIGDFADSIKEGFSHINTEAIDFDTTTQKLCGEQGQPPSKSCDALDIVYSKNKINLIEFKQLRDKGNIEEWIQNLELPQKIKDSRDVLLNIIKKSKFNHKGKITKFNHCEKNVIISFDLTDDATKKTAILLRILTVKAIIEKQFYNNYIQGENFNDPICISMTEFDTEYLKYA